MLNIIVIKIPSLPLERERERGGEKERDRRIGIYVFFLLFSEVVRQKHRK
jgi:hypothetical protein